MASVFNSAALLFNRLGPSFHMLSVTPKKKQQFSVEQQTTSTPSPVEQTIDLLCTIEETEPSLVCIRLAINTDSLIIQNQNTNLRIVVISS